MTGNIFVAGHNGMVGSAICRELNRIGITPITRSKQELDLRVQSLTHDFLLRQRIQYVFMAAAKVGGVRANSGSPVDFIYNNLAIQLSVINASHQAGVKKLLFLGSSCIYPKNAEQPMKEDALLSGPLEPTNQWYAVAKIAGIKLCQAYRRQYDCDFISTMPTNLYGPLDNFHPDTSHVIPAMITRFHKAKLRKEPYVTCWGTGRPRREFLFVDDLAKACVMLMDNYSSEEIINVGSGQELSIADLADTIKRLVGYEGEIRWSGGDGTDGPTRKALDSTKIRNLGWKPEVDLEMGLVRAYHWYLNVRD